MTDISMTKFVDFVMKAGTPKATVVRQWKNRKDYTPSGDYYKSLRESIVESSRSGLGHSPIDAAVANASKSRHQNYIAMAKSYKKWMGRKKTVWFDPPKRTWSANGIGVWVKPELGLEIAGVRHVIKLYFKSDPLNKSRADILLQLMAESFPKHRANGSVTILDVRQSKSFTTASSSKNLSSQLAAEAAYWAALWPTV